MFHDRILTKFYSKKNGKLLKLNGVLFVPVVICGKPFVSDKGIFLVTTKSGKVYTCKVVNGMLKVCHSLKTIPKSEVTDIR